MDGPPSRPRPPRISRLRLSVTAPAGDVTPRGHNVLDVATSPTGGGAYTPTSHPFTRPSRRSSIMLGLAPIMHPSGEVEEKAAVKAKREKEEAKRATRLRRIRAAAACAAVVLILAVVGGILSQAKRAGGGGGGPPKAQAQVTLGGYAAASFTPAVVGFFSATVAQQMGTSPLDVVGACSSLPFNFASAVF